MNSQAIDPRMIEALEGASSLELFQLNALIEGMLADPRADHRRPREHASWADGAVRRLP